MNKWIAVPDDTKKATYEQIGEKTKMSAFAVEKDWWVVKALASVFDTSAASALVFKGGTSLSKGWGLIQRFSEDIDLAIDRDFLGFSGDLTKSQVDKLRKDAGVFVSGPFLEELKQKFEDQGIDPGILQLVESKNSDQDPRIIEVHYPHIIPFPGYLAPPVRIEVSCRSLREPFGKRTFGSLVDEYYQDKDFAQPYITIPVVNPERTFLEKIFLLHEEFQKPSDKIKVERMSRHLYDIVKLSQTDIIDQAIDTPELYSTIVAHRYVFNHIPGVNYQLHQPQTIDPIPKSEYLKAWSEDYSKMRELMFYEENPPTFEEVITQMEAVRKRINELTWQIEMSYLTPNP